MNIEKAHNIVRKRLRHISYDVGSEQTQTVKSKLDNPIETGTMILLSKAAIKCPKKFSLLDTEKKNLFQNDNKNRIDN